MKLLIVSDEEDPLLWDYYRPERLEGVSLILSAGDLKASYLNFLVTMGNRPLLYVHGNHDTAYEEAPPEGCVCVEDRLVIVNGLRILGLGGSFRYNGEPLQYTERQMALRVFRAGCLCRLAGGLDILLTHAPPRGWGDMEDLPHRGFSCFLPLLDRWKPRYLLHGHIHQRYQVNGQRVRQYGETTIINVNGSYTLELPDPVPSGKEPPFSRLFRL